jgi:hypothetical protein
MIAFSRNAFNDKFVICRKRILVCYLKRIGFSTLFYLSMTKLSKDVQMDDQMALGVLRKDCRRGISVAV